MNLRLFAFAAALVAACSGGSDPVVTVGGPSEGDTPGASDPSPRKPNETPIQILCERACVHVQISDCVADAGGDARVCAAACEPSNDMLAAATPPECIDRLATYYDCVAKAMVACNGPTPVPTGCDDAMSSLTSCTDAGVPGSTCMRESGLDSACDQGTHAYLCTGNPPRGCRAIGSQYYCC
jgi:hypothetical protein